MANVANFAGGTGTSTDPYLINSANGLNEIRNFLGSYFKLTANIDLSTSAYSTWTPIDATSSFVNLDGNGYTIKKLHYSGSGPFGFLNYCGTSSNVIKNICFDSFNISITNGTDTGLFAAHAPGTNLTINNCKLINGTIYGGNTGYFVGHGGSTISNCIILNSAIQGGFVYGVYDINCAVSNCIFICSASYGGISGGRDSGLISCTVTNGFVDKEVSGLTGINGLVLKTDAQLKTSSTYSGFNSSIWSITDGQYPELSIIRIEKFLIQDENNICTTDGTGLTKLYTLPYTENMFKNSGFADISKLNSSIISKVSNSNFKVALLKS